MCPFQVQPLWEQGAIPEIDPESDKIMVAFSVKHFPQKAEPTSEKVTRSHQKRRKLWTLFESRNILLWFSWNLDFEQHSMVLRWFYVSGDQAIDEKATKKPPQETSDESSQKKPAKISCLMKNLEIDLPKWSPKVPQNHYKSNPGPPGDPKMALLAAIGSPGRFGTQFGAQNGHTMHPPRS